MRKEVTLASAFTHPNVVKYITSWVDTEEIEKKPDIVELSSDSKEEDVFTDRFQQVECLFCPFFLKLFRFLLEAWIILTWSWTRETRLNGEGKIVGLRHCLMTTKRRIPRKKIWLTVLVLMSSVFPIVRILHSLFNLDTGLSRSPSFWILNYFLVQWGLRGCHLEFIEPLLKLKFVTRFVFKWNSVHWVYDDILSTGTIDTLLLGFKVVLETSTSPGIISLACPTKRPTKRQKHTWWSRSKSPLI